MKMPLGSGKWPYGHHWVVRVGKEFLGKNARPYRRYFNTERDPDQFTTGLQKTESGDLKGAEELKITNHQMAEIRMALEKIGTKPLLDLVAFLEKKGKTLNKLNTLTKP